MKFSLVSATTLACLHSGLCAQDGLVLLQTQVQTAEESHAVQSLFPGLASLKDPRQSRAALAQIQRTVSGLAKDSSQITPAVRALVQTVIDTLGTAFTPIQDDHNLDQGELTSERAAFNNIKLGEATHDGSKVNSTVSTFKDCRLVEDGFCVDVANCVVTSEESNEAFDEADRKLMQWDEKIDGYWCIKNSETEQHRDRTDTVFRNESEYLFEEYIKALHNLTTLQNNITNCGEERKTWVDKIDVCHTEKNEAQAASCAHYESVQTVNQEYTESFGAKVKDLQDLTASVRLREADRKVEYDVLKRTICLLGTLNTPADALDGSLADEASQKAISECSSMMVDTSIVTINYPYQPDISGFQVLPDHPCYAEFGDRLTVEETCTHDAASDTCLLSSMGMSCPCDDTCVVGPADEEPCTSHCTASPPSDAASPDLDTTFYILIDPITTAQVTVTGQEWTATLGAQAITGSASFLYGGSESEKLGFFHGSVALLDNYKNNPDATETTEDTLFRVGGFFYQTTDGGVTTTTMRMIAPASHEDSTHALTFGAKVDFLDTPGCHGSFQTAPDHSWAPEGALEYCFQVDAEQDCCAGGCFIFKFASTGYTCYPVSAGMGLSS